MINYTTDSTDSTDSTDERRIFSILSVFIRSICGIIHFNLNLYYATVQSLFCSFLAFSRSAFRFSFFSASSASILEYASMICRTKR